MTTNDWRQGAIVAGRYRLERKLGSGGMADVWLAEDQELGRKVAVKILHERYANDAQFVERFRREATHAASLSHPNVVSIFDRGTVDGSYYIVMEYIEGRPLDEILAAEGPLHPEETAHRLLCSACLVTLSADTRPPASEPYRARGRTQQNR